MDYLFFFSQKGCFIIHNTSDLIVDPLSWFRIEILTLLLLAFVFQIKIKYTFICSALIFLTNDTQSCLLHVRISFQCCLTKIICCDRKIWINNNNNNNLDLPFFTNKHQTMHNYNSYNLNKHLTILNTFQSQFPHNRFPLPSNITCFKSFLNIFKFGIPLTLIGTSLNPDIYFASEYCSISSLRFVPSCPYYIHISNLFTSVILLKKYVGINPNAKNAIRALWLPPLTYIRLKFFTQRFNLHH